MQPRKGRRLLLLGGLLRGHRVGRGVHRQRQPHDEGRALAGLTLDIERAVHLVNKLLRDGHAEACALVVGAA